MAGRCLKRQAGPVAALRRSALIANYACFCKCDTGALMLTAPVRFLAEKSIGARVKKVCLIIR